MRANLVAIVCALFVLACGRTVPGESQKRQAVECEAGDESGSGSNCGCGDCDDGDACTTDACVDGACSSEPKDCDDDDACTTDSCDGGSCRHELMKCGCDYKCQNGTCVPDSDGEPDRCASIDLPPCSVVDAHNANMDTVIGKTFIDVNRFNFQCFGHYEKKVKPKSVVKTVGQVSNQTINGIKVGAGFENKPLLKSCTEGYCELRGMQMVKNLNVKNVIDCTGKALSAFDAIFTLVTTLEDINDDSCLVQVRMVHPEMKLVAGPPCPVSCTDSSTHTCNACGAEEPDIRSSSFKTLDVQQGGTFTHDTTSTGPCNADWVSRDLCGSRPNNDGWCMRASCGGGPYIYKWIGPDECWNILCAYEAARRDACTAWSDAVCDSMRPPEPKLTCADFEAECGSVTNDKGEVLNCGTCPSGKSCRSNKCIKDCPPPAQAHGGGLCDPIMTGFFACGDGGVLTCRWTGSQYSWQPSEICKNGTVCTSYSYPGSDSCFTGCK